MKKTLLLIATFLVCGALGADLKDFKDNVETTEDQNKKKVADEKKTEPSKSSSSDAACGEACGSCLGVLGSEFCRVGLEVIAPVIAQHMASTTFGPYPYAEGGFVIPPVYKTNDDPEHPQTVAYPMGNRSQWFSFDGRFISLSGIGMGGQGSLNGSFFRFFGPHLEWMVLTDGTDSLSDLELGMNVALAQSDPLSWSVYGGLQVWTGILSRTGGFVGTEFKSYPVKPLELSLRLGFKLFPNYSLMDFEAQGGLFLGPLEAFGGWKSWVNLSNSSDYYAGPFGGLKIHF